MKWQCSAKVESAIGGSCPFMSRAPEVSKVFRSNVRFDCHWQESSKDSCRLLEQQPRCLIEVRGGVYVPSSICCTTGPLARWLMSLNNAP
jgi:hypothetical protein